MLKNYLPFLVLCLGSASLLYGQARDTTYDIPGTHTFTVPAKYKATITVRAFGGGGGGGTGDGNNAKGGGGGGAFATNTYVDVPAGNYTIVVGAGGAPGVNGGSSSYTFTGGPVTAGGGEQGGNRGGAGGTVSGAADADSNAGGNGGGRSNANGAGGGGGGCGNNSPTDGGTPSGNAPGGAGGNPAGGKGGAQGESGQNATNRGGGGGGRGDGGATSGSGGDGRVVVNVTSSVLPVTLSALDLELKNQAVELSWQTSTELNNSKFIIETSHQGETFQRIGEVAGAGTTTEPQNYSFTHHTPSAGINYYRLKQVDFDGTFEYSKVIAINAPGSNDVFAFPNPAREKISVQYDQSKGAGNIQLLDALGRRINANIAGYAGNYEVTLPESLARGTYWLKVERNGKVQTLPVVKE